MICNSLRRSAGAIFAAVLATSVAVADSHRLDPNDPDDALTIGRKIGCSTNANLGQMVADPLDLQQGRPAGAADGEAASLSIQRYRRGETRELENSELGVTN